MALKTLERLFKRDVPSIDLGFQASPLKFLPTE